MKALIRTSPRFRAGVLQRISMRSTFVTLVTVLVGALSLLPAMTVPAWANGETWVLADATEAINWRSVATDGNGVWVAVANTGTNRVMRSTDDGETWTAVELPEVVSGRAWNAVAHGNGVWVAVSGGSGDLFRAMRSTDGGLTWTGLDAGGTSSDGTWRSVAYGNGVWIAVGDGGTTNAMRSTDDGLNWSPLASFEAIDWYEVATDGDGVWVAVANTGTNRVRRSTDNGATWTALGSAAGVEASDWQSVAHGDGLWVAVADSGTNQVMTSADGATWTARAAAENSYWTSVAYGDGVWVAVGATVFSRDQVMTSKDGETWTARTEAANRNWVSVATDGNGAWVAVAGNDRGDTDRVMLSPEPSSPSSSSNSSSDSRSDSSGASGTPGIFLYIEADSGELAGGSQIHFGSYSTAANSPYALTLEGMGSTNYSRVVLSRGNTNTGGHLDTRALLPDLVAGSYKIVMLGYHEAGYPLALTNHIVIGTSGSFLSVSPESLQPLLK